MALLTGTFTLTAVESIRKTKNGNKGLGCLCENAVYNDISLSIPQSQYVPLTRLNRPKKDGNEIP
ncbi:MAG: hypothetical protein M3162_07255 [Thermoproteota archaeon]|nr:hypothetical protein [Thermoproteota archaeon]